MQGLFISLAKASKQKGLAFIKTTSVGACDSKKIVTAHSMPAKIQLCTEITISKTVNAYRLKYVFIWK